MFAHEDMNTICGAIKSSNTRHFEVANCFEDGIESQTLKTITLNLDGNGMSSREAVVITQFLSSNPNLKGLHVKGNRFDGADAAVLANALSSNTNLYTLSVSGNEIKRNGRFSFLCAIFDVSGLTSCAESNHTCRVYVEQGISVLNGYEVASWNKWTKIFAMLALSSKDQFMNTTLLRGVPVQLIPVLLDWADKDPQGDGDGGSNPQLTDLYLERTNATRCQQHDVWDNLGVTRSLNCVYELMRCWVVPLIFV